MHKSYANPVKWAALALLSTAVLYLITLVYASGQIVVGSLVLVAYALAVYVFTSKRTYTQRYLFPGLGGIAVFVLLPLLFTIWMGFTNYSSSNFLTFERATDVLLSQTYRKDDQSYLFTLHAEGESFRLLLTPEVVEEEEVIEEEEEAEEGGSIFNEPEEDSIFDEPEEDSIFGEPNEGEGDTEANTGAADAAPGDAAATNDAAGDTAAAAGTEPPQEAEAPEAKPASAQPEGPFVTMPISLTGTEPIKIEAIPLEGSGITLSEPLPIRAVIEQQEALKNVKVELPGDGITVGNSGLRTFAADRPVYVMNSDGTLTNQLTGAVLSPNHDTGFYETKDGETVTPGFRVFVGFQNFVRVFTDPGFQEPFFKIFLWTVGFAGLTVLFSLIVGSLLAELLNWEGLRFRAVYRLLLFVPYAVPGFISILVFKGLFNQNFGEINLILGKLLGIRPDWFSNEYLARSMLLIVNTWLGYPYMMLLCMGLRQSISKDLYEATALAGAGPLTNYFKITWPLIRKPLTPLLISAFAFNFNNFVLVSLLTGGRPDFIGTKVPAGTTDILVTYTYRIAFEDSGKNFGLAAAISTVIFLLVAGLALANLKLTKVNATQNQ